MSTIIEKVNLQFDKQIKKDKKFQVHKDLFNLTNDFTLDDWRTMRTERYWDIYDKLSYDKKKEFTLQCVKEYINDNRKY